MRKLLFILGLVFCASHARAATCPVSSGASSATIVSTIQGCASGNTATFAAGTGYTLSTTVNIPCGVSITGPTVPLALYTGGDGYRRYGYTPTAAVTWTGGAESSMFTTSGCSTAQTIQYMEFNGNRPSPDGGQVLNIGYGQSNLTVQYNYFHGNQGNAGSGEYFNDPLIYFGGNTSGSPVDSNNVVQWNRFGANGDCSNLMNNTSYPGFGGDGGYCVGTGVHTALNNFAYQNNVTDYQEQGLKFFEASGFVGTGTLSVFYNDFSNIHRISIESQNSPNVMNYWYNDVHDQVDPQFGSWLFSLPSWWTNANYANSEYNVMVSNIAPTGGSYIPGAFEFWAAGTNSYNLVQGYQACGTQWGNGDVPSPWSINYNTFQLTQGTAICNEEGRPSGDAPTQTGNTTSTTVSTQTSVAPTISPASGSYSAGQVITISNSGTNRDVNTSAWCTTDGSTPVPGSGTAAILTSYTLATNTTLKCVGMWGAPNQPASYASGYGYVPSSVVTNTYTTSGLPSLTGCFQTNSGSVSNITVGQYVQQATNCTYSSGPSPLVCSPTADANGNVVTAWGSISGAAISIGAVGAGAGCSGALQGAGCVKGIAAGTASATATVTGGISCTSYPFTVTGPPPTLNSAAMVVKTGGTSVTIGSPVIMCVNLGYITPTATTQVCGSGSDTYGTTVNTYVSSSPSNATIVSSTGVLTGVSAGSTTVSASVNSGAFTPSLAVSVVNPPVIPQAGLQGPVNLQGNVIIP